MDYKQLIAQLIKIDGVQTDEIYSLLALPKDSSMGDYCLPCFKFASLLKTSPVIIAKNVAQSVVLPEFLSAVEAVGGYVNFTLNKQDFAQRVLQKISAEGENYGKSDEGAGKTICIDYSSVNIAKPFHMGHLLNTVIGGALYRIFGVLGYNVVGINHLGDWGTQFGKLIVAYKKWGDKEDIDRRGVRGLLDIYVRFHKEAQTNPQLDDEARAWFKAIEDGNEEALTLFDWFKQITLKEVGKIYDRLNVRFDSYAGESFYNDKMAPVLDRLKQMGLLEESDGAQVVRFDEKEDMPPCLLVRADGATLYATRDMAAAFYRKKTYDFYKCLYVVAYQQNLHFRQIFKVLEMMGCEWSKDMVHVAHGMVSLEDGALSTRDGNVVFLEDVLNKAVAKAADIINEKNPDLPDKQATAEMVGVGAIIFGVLFNSRIKDMVFSYDKALNFDGETGPYVQYTYARCNSLLERCGNIQEAPDYAGVDNKESNDLIRLLDRYPDILKDCARKYEPSILTRYVVEVAKAFNKFYFEHNINNAPAPIKKARLILVQATKQVIFNGLTMLGIKAPAKM
ncbi:MAG: arginine--tRNA ligase [Christensenellales bacterium]